MATFQDCKQKGKISENYFSNAYNKITNTKLIDVREDSYYQKIDVDYLSSISLIDLHYSKDFKVEVKTIKTNTVFIESMINNNPLKGWIHYCQADALVLPVDELSFYVYDFKKVKEYHDYCVENCIEESRYFPINQHGTLLIKMPIDAIDYTFIKVNYKGNFYLQSKDDTSILTDIYCDYNRARSYYNETTSTLYHNN